MIDETDRLLQSAADSGDKAFETVRESFTEQVGQMREQLDLLEGYASDRARRALRAADRSVHDHPYGAIGIAAGIGLLVGFLAARR